MKLLVTSIFICGCGLAIANDVQLMFQSSEIVPDVLTKAPNDLLSVRFNDKVIEFGEVLTPTQAKDVPNIAWKFEDSEFYTICMTAPYVHEYTSGEYFKASVTMKNAPPDSKIRSPDSKSRINPRLREALHWLVVNVQGSDVSKGDLLAAYVGSGPENGTGLHRYVLLVYKQLGKLDVVAEKRLGNNSIKGRSLFSIRKFTDKYELGTPIAGNMYEAEYDDYVPKLQRQLFGLGQEKCD